tara:strand:- start:7959 stop:8222 length:264 start_codon:yes stop_codon:yes gene_type:complete
MAYTPYKAQRMQSPMAQTKTYTKSKKLLKSEHKDTEITGGNKNEEIVDIKDRIQFIEEDISNQDGKINPTQRADLATLDQKLRKLKK